MNKLYDPFSFSKSAIGFDEILRRLTETDITKLPTFPPYNVRKTGENTYVIEMAVAGFGRQDIELTLDGDVLTVSGNTTLAANNLDEYLYKGIADRSFTRKFTIADAVEVKNAELVNGMLKVWLERFIPEEKKAKSIPINDSTEKQNDKPTPQFLAEKKVAM